MSITPRKNAGILESNYFHIYEIVIGKAWVP